MTWYYKGVEYRPTEDELKQHYGFVYIITELSTNKKYVGKKQFWNTKKLQPLKGKKRKRIVVVESDWKNYYGSSDVVKQLVEANGANAFHREILHFCNSKGELSYVELVEQVDRQVLLRDDYYNGIIQCRINKSHLKGMQK